MPRIPQTPQITHDGKKWKMYYFNNNYDDLLADIADFIEKLPDEEEVVSIFPNVGRPLMSYAGIVGATIIVKKIIA